MELERSRLQEKGRLVVERIDRYSAEMAEGSQEAAVSLLKTLVPIEPDVGPEIKIEAIELSHLQIFGGLSREEVLAVTLAKDFCSKFNRNFGVGTNAGEHLDWNENSIRWFFEHLGATLQAILHPDGQYAQNAMGVVGHLGLATQHYYELIILAENQLSQPANRR